jgi:hypothetical protein
MESKEARHTEKLLKLSDKAARAARRAERASKVGKITVKEVNDVEGSAREKACGGGSRLGDSNSKRHLGKPFSKEKTIQD